MNADMTIWNVVFICEFLVRNFQVPVYKYTDWKSEYSAEIFEMHLIKFFWIISLKLYLIFIVKALLIPRSIQENPDRHFRAV
jgi:hypothetical protein